MLGPQLPCPDPQLTEPDRLGAAVVEVLELGLRRPDPAIEEGIELVVWRGVVGERTQPVGVDDHASRVEAVAIGHRRHHIGGQSTTKPRHVVLERRLRVTRRIDRPESVGGDVGGHHPAPAQHEQGQQSPLERALGCAVTSLGVEDSDRTEHLDADPVVARHRPIRSPRASLDETRPSAGEDYASSVPRIGPSTTCHSPPEPLRPTVHSTTRPPLFQIDSDMSK
jgi:hypothetical protein